MKRREKADLVNLTLKITPIIFLPSIAGFTYLRITGGYIIPPDYRFYVVNTLEAFAIGAFGLFLVALVVKMEIDLGEGE